MSEDPAKDGYNWYAYCANNPCVRIDSNGLSWVDDLLKGVGNFFSGVEDFLISALQFQANAEIEKVELADDAQKNIQRGIWATGAQSFLREQKGFLTSAWMLEHSLQDNLDDIYRGNDSRIAYLINNDSEYLRKLDEAISLSSNGTINQNLEDIAFDTGDLYYSIHQATIHVEGYRQDDGSWFIHAILSDTYDFTEIQSFMSNKGWSTDVGLGTLANDAAVISQNLGAISPYNVTVEFYTTR